MFDRRYSAKAFTLATTHLDFFEFSDNLKPFVSLRSVLNHDLFEELFGAWVSTEEGPFKDIKIYGFVFNLARDIAQAEVDHVKVA